MVGNRATLGGTLEETGLPCAHEKNLPTPPVLLVYFLLLSDCDNTSSSHFF